MIFAWGCSNHQCLNNFCFKIHLSCIFMKYTGTLSSRDIFFLFFKELKRSFQPSFAVFTVLSHEVWPNECTDVWKKKCPYCGMALWATDSRNSHKAMKTNWICNTFLKGSAEVGAFLLFFFFVLLNTTTMRWIKI